MLISSQSMRLLLKCASLLALPVTSIWAQSELYRTSFEPMEGYPYEGTIIGYPGVDSTWGTWTGSKPQTAHWNAIGGGYAARLYGTSTGMVSFKTPRDTNAIRLEGYLLANFAPDKVGRLDFGVLSGETDVQWIIAIALSEDGNLYYRNAQGIQLAADNFVVNGGQYYHVALAVDFASGQARVYVNPTRPNQASAISQGDLLTFGGKAEIPFEPTGGFSGSIGLDAMEGAEGFFDDISVQALPASVVKNWAPKPKKGEPGWSPHPDIGVNTSAAVQPTPRYEETYRVPSPKIVQPVIGLCGGGRYYNSFTPLMKGSGAETIRFHYQWHEVEKEKGVYDLPASAFDYMRVLQASQLELLHILAYDNVLYNTRDRKGMENFSWFEGQGQEFINGYANYCAWMVRTFGARGTGQIKFWEIWNEPNAGSADDYMKLLRESVKRMRAEDPEAFIVMGGVSRSNIRFLEACLKQGAAELVDAVAFHPYREGFAPEETFNPVKYGFAPGAVECYADEVAIIQDTVTKYTPKDKEPLELWITELGCWTIDARPYYSSKLAVTHDVQAKYLLRTYLQNFALGVNRIYWYDLVGSFGITYGNKQPRPAYHAMSNLSKVIPQGQNLRVLDWKVSSQPGVRDLHVYAFQPDPKTVLLFYWKGGEAGNSPVRYDEWEKVNLTIPHVLAGEQMKIAGLDIFSNIAFEASAKKTGPRATIIEGVPVWDSPVMLELRVSPDSSETQTTWIQP